MANLARIDQRIAARHLLRHPFYLSWTAGTLPRESLLEYARQYFAFESNLPRYLTAMHARSESPRVRAALLANAWDEEHGEQNHAELWLPFAGSLGLSRGEVEKATRSPATRTLVDTYWAAASPAPVEGGVAALHAYESQLPAASESKWWGSNVTTAYRVTRWRSSRCIARSTFTTPPRSERSSRMRRRPTMRRSRGPTMRSTRGGDFLSSFHAGDCAA